MKNQTIIFIISCLFCTLSISAQDNGLFPSSNSISNITREIKLKDDSKIEEVEIFVGDQDRELELQIRSSVSKGKLLIELYDPSGKKQGKFSIGTQMSSEKKERVQGTMNKRLKDPKPGSWKVKIIPKNVEASILIEVVVKQ